MHGGFSKTSTCGVQDREIKVIGIHSSLCVEQEQYVMLGSDMFIKIKQSDKLGFWFSLLQMDYALSNNSNDDNVCFFSFSKS